MASQSRNQLRFQRSLRGYVVLMPFKSPKISLALNHGPTINGLGWGFDWLGRATVFKTKDSARTAISQLSRSDRRLNIVPVSKIAVLVLDIDDRFRLFHHLEVKRNIKEMGDPLLTRINQYLKAAELQGTTATEALKLGKRYLKKAEILRGLIKPKKQKKKKTKKLLKCDGQVHLYLNGRNKKCQCGKYAHD